MPSYADAKTGCEHVETTVRKRRIRFAGFVACMDNERLPKQMMFGELEGEKSYLGGPEQDWMSCIELDLSLLNFVHRRETMDVGSEQIGLVVQTC